MKTTLLAATALAIALAGNCPALTPVDETFNQDSLDPATWFQYTRGKGELSPSNKKLNFVVKKNASKDDFASIELLTSQPGYNEDWELVLSLKNTTGLGDSSGCGIMLFNVEDRRDFMYLEFYGKGRKGGVAAGVLVNGKHPENAKARVNPNVSKGSIRVTFDKKKKRMTLFVAPSTKPKDGDWIKIGTFSPKGSGGNINANWRMNRTKGRFGVQLFGFGENQVIPAGKMTLDSLRIHAPR